MERVISRILEMFEESIILQGFITVAFAGTYCYLIVTGRQVPDGLEKLVWTVLGFWFGTKSQAAMSSTMKRLGNGKSSPNTVVVDCNSSG